MLGSMSKAAFGLLAFSASLGDAQQTTVSYTKDHPYIEPPKPNGLAIEKPNIIMFMPDQLRYDAVGVFGNDIIKTPNIDAFAEEATRFTNIFTQASVCSQSRCSMFTGNYPHVSGHRTLNNLLKPWEPNVFRSMKEHGYHVAYLSPRGDFYADNATELGVNEYGFLTEQTLPEFASEPFQPDQDNIWNRLFYTGKRNATEAQDYDETMIRGALKWLENPPQDKPWVLFLPLVFPHPPFSVEDPFFSMYNRSEMPLPASQKERAGYEPMFHKAIRDNYGTERATDEMWQEVKATYYGMVSRVDWQFGRIVNKTKEAGLWDSTVTMFFTDHGEYLGDYGLVEKWPSGVDDALTHEPLLIGGAGLPRGVVYEEMGEMVDLVPTVLALGTVPATYAQYGVSLLEAMHAAGRGETLPHKAYAYSEGGFLRAEEPLLEQGPFPYDIKIALQHNDTALVGKAVAVRSKEWTYVYRLYEADELYSRAPGADPHELRNLAADPAHAGARAALREVALRWHVETADTVWWYLDERTPQVKLPSPYEQYVMRAGQEGDCVGESCQSLTSSTMTTTAP
ncbi:alkaline-phosphatase-like protein [Xylariomycetidae sp. FL0641]|nr:alkaline-phosphatase-like protein [Xylariomycetidae sp. FL0641]